jgi:hypothetical protein
LRLLVIEDRLSGILKSKLGDIGFTVDIAGSAADAAPRSSSSIMTPPSSILACPMVTGSPF